MKKDGFSCSQCAKWRKPNELWLHHECVYCHAKSVSRKLDPPSVAKHRRKGAEKKYMSGKLPPWMFS